ncbi:MAG TPA: EAL domain-containing protein [Stellaceae bacterium]|nr:EAL domain-containing protein [Stellaceae bacterium]
MPNDALTQLRSERDRFVAFSFAGADLLIQIDDEGIIEYAAGAARRMTGQEAAALLGQPLARFIVAEDRPLVGALLRRLSRSNVRSEPAMIRLAADGADGVPAILAGCKLPAVAAGFHLTLSEAHPAAAAAALSEQRDPATGLLSAAAFEKRAVETLRIAKDLGRDLGLTLVELSDFDQFVRQAGQARGDALLSDVGGSLRAASIAGNSAGRLAGARFGVVHEVGRLSSELLSEVDALTRSADPKGIIAVEGRNLDLPLNRMTPGDAVNALAYAVAQFASQGAAAFTLTSVEDGLKALIAETLERVASFKTTVAEEQFDLAYQPIVALGTRGLHHYEVLTRFEEGTSPYETIRFAESVWLTGEFDLAVCRRALETLRALDKSARPMLAVNVSTRSIASDIFVGALRALLTQYADCRRQLMFEITESAQIQDLVRAGNVIHALQADKHCVCLDDFGAGSASFPYLRALNVDFVKIDGAYIRQAASDKRDRAIVKSMTMLCRDLGIGTIAEMIEAEDQRALVAELGAEYGQGWLFGRPGPLPEPKPPESARPLLARRRGFVERWE